MSGRLLWVSLLGLGGLVERHLTTVQDFACVHVYGCKLRWRTTVDRSATCFVLCALYLVLLVRRVASAVGRVQHVISQVGDLSAPVTAG